MPFDDFLQAILPLKKMCKDNAITIAITGGEPLLRKDLALCGKTLREQGFRWGIVTNGYDYAPDMHARLLAAGMGTITLSLDGLENAHNWLRANKKSFENAVKALGLIVSSKGLAYDVVPCVKWNKTKPLSGYLGGPWRSLYCRLMASPPAALNPASAPWQCGFPNICFGQEQGFRAKRNPQKISCPAKGRPIPVSPFLF
jgi:hypothetical protein